MDTAGLSYETLETIKLYDERLDVEELIDAVPHNYREKLTFKFNVELKDATYIGAGDEFLCTTNINLKNSHPAVYMYMLQELGSEIGANSKWLTVRCGMVTPESRGRLNVRIVNNSSHPFFLPAGVKVAAFYLKPYVN